MPDKQAQADVAHIRQTTQFTCCAASIAAALKAHGKNVSEDDVNKVLGAAPMAGATWEAMLATVQYFGLRGSLVVPSTPRMLKAWTDQGLPVLIAWNPENRPWSHASVVFDVVEGADGVLQVHVMDPNIPNPSRHVRVLNEDEFCQKWGEKVSDTLIVRRPAMVIEREVTVEGRQVRASARKEAEGHDCLKDYKSGGMTWAEYQDCLKRFKDEEDDAWRSSRPRVPTTPVPPDFRYRAERLIMALWFSDAKGRKFVKDNLYKSALSDKQMSWFESLERKYSRVIADMPDKPPLSFPTDGSLWVHVDRISDAERVKLEKHFYLDANQGRGREWAVRPKTEAPAIVAPPQESAPATSGRTLFDQSVQTQMLAVLDTLIERTNSGMLKGFKRDLETGKGLTEDQMKAIRHNLYKSGMRPQADLFRLASDHTAGVEKVRWAPLSGGGVKFVDEEVMVFISPKEAAVREAGHREVQRLGPLRAFWEYNSSDMRVYGILDYDFEGAPTVGMIVWNRKSNTWKVVQHLDAGENERRTLGTFTAAEDREGVKRALMTFHEKRVKLGWPEESEMSEMSKSAKAPAPVPEKKKDPNNFTVEGPARRNPIVREMIERGPGGAGKHHNRERDVEKGKSRKDKHKKDWHEKDAVSRVADRFLAEQE